MTIMDTVSVLICNKLLPFSARIVTGSEGSEGWLMFTAVLAIALN